MNTRHSEPCPDCDGSGRIRDRGIMETCHKCHGTGNVFPGERPECIRCLGTGKIHHRSRPDVDTCPDCNGTGKTPPAICGVVAPDGARCIREAGHPGHVHPNAHTFRTPKEPKHNHDYPDDGWRWDCPVCNPEETTPKEPTMENTLKITTHHDLTRKDLADFIAHIPEGSKIRIRQTHGDPHDPRESGQTSTTLEASWDARMANPQFP